MFFMNEVIFYYFMDEAESLMPLVLIDDCVQYHHAEEDFQNCSEEIIRLYGSTNPLS